MVADEEIKELKKELKKLKPKERLKKLKELEEKTKDEIVAIADLIKDSEKDLKTETVAEDVTPKQEDVDIGRLFDEDLAQLESTVKKEAPPDAEAAPGYLSFQQAYGDYQQLKNITYASMEGNLEPTHLKAIDKIGERLDTRKYHSTSAEVANILVASKAALYKIKKYAGLDRPSNF
jgi:hypothetical protein|tara:strand:+ start:167 stop:697 length:531 start_codon:yes stop_codon:yes gene_type:complete